MPTHPPLIVNHCVLPPPLDALLFLQARDADRQGRPLGQPKHSRPILWARRPCGCQDDDKTGRDAQARASGGRGYQQPLARQHGRAHNTRGRDDVNNAVFYVEKARNRYIVRCARVLSLHSLPFVEINIICDGCFKAAIQRFDTLTSSPTRSIRVKSCQRVGLGFFLGFGGSPVESIEKNVIPVAGVCSSVGYHFTIAPLHRAGNPQRQRGGGCTVYSLPQLFIVHTGNSRYVSIN